MPVVDDQIMRYISRYPGSSFSEIMDSLFMNESTLRYHLEKFERKSLLYSKKIGKRRCYFCRSDDTRSKKMGYGLTVLQKRVLSVITSDPGVTRKEIMNRISIPGSSLTEILNTLMKKGCILKKRDDNKVGYEIISKEQLKAKIFKQLVIRLINREIDEQVFKELSDELDKRL
jgi:predicted transcriptional regulator